MSLLLFRPVFRKIHFLQQRRASEAARHTSEAPAERSKTEKFFGVPVRHLVEDLPGDLLFRQEPLQKER